MVGTARIEAPVTAAEFDAFLEAQADEALWELVGGRIVMMTNPTEEHEQIAGNIGAPLKLAMGARGCRTYQGGMRVQRSADGAGNDRPRPDVLVRCGPSSRCSFVTDPLVVEVLSPSAMDRGRGEKPDLYKSLPTLRHIVLAYQDQMRVEHYRRSGDGLDAEVLTGAGDVLRLEAVAFGIGLARIYHGVDAPGTRETPGSPG